MRIYHSTWLPPDGKDFNNFGQFLFLIETDKIMASKRRKGWHPTSLGPANIKEQLVSDLKTTGSKLKKMGITASDFTMPFPTYDDTPLPSSEMAQLTGTILPHAYTWQTWKVAALAIKEPLIFLRELQYKLTVNPSGVQAGSDLLFWMRYTHALINIAKLHQYLPVMRCRPPKGSDKGSVSVYLSWLPVAQTYERYLREFAAAMPAVCAASTTDETGRTIEPTELPFPDRLSLLRHYSEQQFDWLVQNTAFPKYFVDTFKDSWLGYALTEFHRNNPDASMDVSKDDWKQWKAWYNRIAGEKKEVGFVLGIRLDEVDVNRELSWQIRFFVESFRNPSLKIDLADWWELTKAKKSRWTKEFGKQFERNLLVSLGNAARICPLLWEGMENDQPIGLELDTDDAYEFLTDDALVLESAGFRILWPSWWTPEGRRRPHIRIRVSKRPAAKSDSAANTSGLLSLNKLVDYHYDLVVGSEPVTVDEWLTLVNAKEPLFKFRGQWVEVEQVQLIYMLSLWKRNQANNDGIEVNQLFRDVAKFDPETYEFELDNDLDGVLNGLQNQERIQAAANPTSLRGELRYYQKIGLAWLLKLEQLGLNPCLADDMGLGKTIQLIALMLNEREAAQTNGKCLPTLLIAPTSVLSNWQKEVDKFAPSLTCAMHHGSTRPRDEESFKQAISGVDLVITSFALARSDQEVFRACQWGRLIVDEAQNIKNPKSEQAKAICTFEAPRRIAVTGTPVENRLMDLWSLFNFLNPGYLGAIGQFKKVYETPIQRDSDTQLSKQLQQLVRPFILRRLKTDKSIIDDLPDKVEQKVYCNLTREQASLYQLVVDDVQQQIEKAEGMQRRGLILATLMKLKQICNHPAQFLQDGSAFSDSRSHKLTRLNEMVDEALDESNSLLVFTQFTHVGKQLEELLRERHNCPVHYLHGGTSRVNREKMIESFQDKDSPPEIFVLSLKAGGAGITLTRANHVFHFDRWWNPAVENQATDRAYRIGQEKTVFVHKMVVLGTLEERIDEMIETKQSMAEKIVDGNEDWLTEMDNNAFRELIALNRKMILEA